MKTLVIAEKPSVATDLARVIGKLKKTGDHYEGDDYVVASAIGHLVELPMPDDIDPKLKRWSIKTLPILPDKFKLKPIEKTKKRFNDLKKLLKRKDVGDVINACDAGREGELIFSYIYELAKCKKPVKRLWMMSMTVDSIKAALSNLRDHESMSSLLDAARCRSESDWLIGINGTRALTTRMMGARHGQAATVGRVQTPTLSIIVKREDDIRNFKPRSYWRIEMGFGLSAGEYMGQYQKPGFKKGDDEHDRVVRIWDKAIAEKVANDLESASTALVSDKKRHTRQSAPRLYDLTTLQREANNRFSLPANKTLRIAQSLYEKHKMLTYPRTDSKALPEDYGQTCNVVMSSLDGEYAEHASKVLKNGWIKTDNKRIFNNKQISDHFAIIPTEVTGKKLSDDEAKIYDMVVRRFIAVFHPPAEFDETTRESVVGDHTFVTNGKVLVVPGWLDVYGKAYNAKDSLVSIGPEDGDPAQAKIMSFDMIEEATKPPPRYTEATLLAAMEGAGKFLEDEELIEVMKEKGLGTPATRAQTIEHLIYERYLERDRRDIIPMTKAENLILFLNALEIEDLTSPAMTGEWEQKLHQIEIGEITRDEFMKGIREMTTKIVENTRNFDEAKVPTTPTTLPSPVDGKCLLETFRAYRSEDNEFRVYKTIGNRRMDEKEIRELLEKGKIGPLDGFRSKAGKPYSAILRLDEEHKVKFVFENNNAENGGDIADLSEFPVIAKCPQSGVDIHETTNAYVWAGEVKRRVARTILSRQITPDQFHKMLKEGKTDLLDKFRSKRTGKYFSAYIKLDDQGKIGFEFKPREAAKKKVAKKVEKKSDKEES